MNADVGISRLLECIANLLAVLSAVFIFGCGDATVEVRMTSTSITVDGSPAKDITDAVDVIPRANPEMVNILICADTSPEKLASFDHELRAKSQAKETATLTEKACVR